MSRLEFRSNHSQTLGVELELALVDAKTMALSSSILDVLERVPAEHAKHVKPELMQCYVEINTGVCRTVGEVEADLRGRLHALEGIVADLGLRLFWTSTHPFSRWQEQRQTPDERYSRLIDNLQDVARQLVTFGLHVHVGVDSGDKAVMVCDRIQRHLPTLLALSCNSPWWQNRTTGLQSYRSKVMENLPTAGMPPVMRNWSEYVWLVNHLLHTHFIGSIRDLWWDVRPHHNFGTVEVRVCDMPGTLEDALGIVALIQSLVRALDEQVEEGTYQLEYHPMMVRQNKWRAARYGLEAQLVNPSTHEALAARDVVLELTELVRPQAEHLGCLEYLEHARTMAAGPTGADRQLALLQETGDRAEVVRRLTGG
ncbi:MAG: YbdK family carboxylate-amine ligase [Bryobacteraceae bacterium]